MRVCKVIQVPNLNIFTAIGVTDDRYWVFSLRLVIYNYYAMNIRHVIIYIYYYKIIFLFNNNQSVTDTEYIGKQNNIFIYQNYKNDCIHAHVTINYVNSY